MRDAEPADVAVIQAIYAHHVLNGLGELVRRCEAGEWRQMLAVIGDSGNAGSIALHRRLGFETAGTLKSVGFKFGRWVDTVLMQRRLGQGDATLPPAVSQRQG